MGDAVFELTDAHIRLAPSLVRTACVMKLERHFLAWSATSYRPSTSWMLVGLTFKGDVSGLA